MIRSGHRIGDRAPLALLELVDNPNDYKFESTTKTLARELALKARASEGEGGGSRVWWEFKRAIEKDPQSITTTTTTTKDQEGGIWSGIAPLTKKNLIKAMRYREPTTTTSISTSASGPALNDPTESSTTTTTSQFLDRVHHHYLHHLATLSLQRYEPSTTLTIKQLTQRLKSSDDSSSRGMIGKGKPRPVLTVPMQGNKLKAGQQTWTDLQERESETRGETRRIVAAGPIGRSKNKSTTRVVEARGIPRIDLDTV